MRRKNFLLTGFALLCAIVTMADEIDFDLTKNIALNCTTVASSAGEPADAAVDGNSGTRWASDVTDAEWWYVDLADVYDLNKIEILWEGAWGKNFELYGATTLPESPAGDTGWALIKSVNRDLSGPFPYLEAFLADGAAARYVKFKGISRGTPYGYSFWEFKVFAYGKHVEVADPMLTSVKISPNPIELFIGENTLIEIAPLNQGGGFFKGATIELTVNDNTKVDLSNQDGKYFIKGLQAGSYTLTATAVFNGVTVSSTASLTVKGLLPYEITTTTEDGLQLTNLEAFYANPTVFTDEMDGEKSYVKTVSTGGDSGGGIKFKKLNSEVTSKKYAYAHVICKVPKRNQKIGAIFGYGDVEMQNISLIENVWQDVVFAISKTEPGSYISPREITIRPDREVIGSIETPKEICIHKIVFNGSSTSLIVDTQVPVLTGVTFKEATYSSISITVEAIDNFGIASYLVKDQSKGIDQTLEALDNVITVKGLLPETAYNFRIQAKDAADNVSEILNLDASTSSRVTNCSGDFAHFSMSDEKKIHYEISYRGGVTTFTMNPIGEERTLDFAEILIKDKNGNSIAQYVGMPITDGGKTATFTGTYEQHEILYIAFVYSLDDMDGNEQSAQTNGASIVDTDKAIFYIVGECTGPLGKDGTDTDPILSGKWNQETFEGYNLDYIKLTTIDLTGVIGMTALPAMAGLNPNCLIYVDRNASITDNTKNIVMFDKSVGTAANVILQDGYSFNNTKEFNATAISYTRDFTGITGWTSICLPFTVNVGDREVESLSDYTDDSFQFTQVSETTAPNTPYIMAVKNMTNETISGSGVVPVSILNEVKVNDNAYMFKGTYNKIGKGNAENCYLLHEDGSAFEIGSATSSVPAFRAYITSDSPFSADQIMVLHNGATKIDLQNAETNILVWSGNGILEIVANEAQTVKMYNINGCMIRNIELNKGSNSIMNLQKGVYIINNQKIVVR